MVAGFSALGVHVPQKALPTEPLPQPHRSCFERKTVTEKVSRLKVLNGIEC